MDELPLDLEPPLDFISVVYFLPFHVNVFLPAFLAAANASLKLAMFVPPTPYAGRAEKPEKPTCAS